nr:hypothetical protein Iba_chr13aCG11040 [Ipomoea batatas]
MTQNTTSKTETLKRKNVIEEKACKASVWSDSSEDSDLLEHALPREVPGGYYLDLDIINRYGCRSVVERLISHTQWAKVFSWRGDTYASVIYEFVSTLECNRKVANDNWRPIKFYLFGTEYHISVNELAKCLGVWDPESVVDDFPVAMDAKSYLNGANNTIELQKVKDAYERHLTRKDLKIVRRLCWGMGIEKELRGGSVIKRVMHFPMAELEMASIRPITLPSEEEEPEEPTQASQIQSPLAPTPTMPAAAAGRPSSIMPERTQTGVARSSVAMKEKDITGDLTQG